MKIRATLLTLVAVVGSFLLVSNTSQASAATYSDTGTLSSDGTWASTLTFTDPNVTATFDVTNMNYKATISDSLYHCMQTDSCGWWGVDDENGYNCWDTGPYVASDCDYQTSLNNSLAAFTPSSVAATKGVMWNWHSRLCGPNNSVYPIPANPNINCPNVSTVTIQFSAPVSNAILHIGNLGGSARFPGSRKTAGFDKNFDMTLYSKWTLTSGQDITMLSGENTTNITLDNNTIRNKYIPQGVGARPGVGECAYNGQTCRNKNGSGSGSFLIGGTYSTITFNIDLGFSLVNYGWSEPTTSALVDSWSKSGLIEGVAVQISFYKYQLSYNLGGGTGTTPSTVTGLDQGDTTTLANGTGFTKTGYEFAGWNCDNSIGAKAAESTATQPAADVICTAQWTAVAAPSSLPATGPRTDRSLEIVMWLLTAGCALQLLKPSARRRWY